MKRVGLLPRYLATLILTGLAIFLTAGCADEGNVDISTPGEVKIVAHRGAMSERPENTLASYQHAVELGADIVETDLRTSRDGHLFVLHDRNLERTTSGEGLATDFTLEELQQLDAGSWFDPTYMDQKIPSFRDVLDWARESGATLLLDLKESGREYAENVSNEIINLSMEDQVIVGVRSPEQANEFTELLPGSRLLAFMRSADDIEAYAAADVDVIRLWLRWLQENPELAERVSETGRKLMINGTDGNPEEAREIMKFNPDWILIDDIKKLQGSLKEIESSPVTQSQ